MPPQEKQPGESNSRAEMGAGLFLIVCTLPFLLLLAGVGFYLDNRLVEIEDRLDYVPPSSYQPPNLDDYGAGEVSIDELSREQWVYVPVYSHIYFQGGSPYLLETTLSIRNVDRDQPIYLKAVEYYDTAGKLAKTYVDHLIKLAPLETIEFLVPARDSTGGSGANFLVHWMADDDVDAPVIEAMMVGTAGTQGISFSRSGVDVSPPDDAAE